ncbi:hypothetical protein FOS14_02610 [Skermania sp. ID1734]|uniref:hypothetical protein n=1 Tax=Skermania sp. ID1734 TaxID=2597516 RepID=UPI00117CC21A|nr:hypothetical protein [Skermania sp. ID1734]TSE01463.1 hypothetical protein FOS14_02610 [Skermania sp. ID1734]
MRRARIWIIGMALTPLAFAAFSAGALFVMNEAANTSLATYVAAWWMFVLIFGAALLAPCMALSIVGATSLGRWPRGGRAIAATGLILTSAVALLFSSSCVIDSLSEQPDPNDLRWLAQLPIHGAALFTAPFLMLVAGNMHAMRALWATRRPAE